MDKTHVQIELFQFQPDRVATVPVEGRKPRATNSRPAISEKRLSLTPNGNVRYQLVQHSTER